MTAGLFTTRHGFLSRAVSCYRLNLSLYLSRKGLAKRQLGIRPPGPIPNASLLQQPAESCIYVVGAIPGLLEKASSNVGKMLVIVVWTLVSLVPLPVIVNFCFLAAQRTENTPITRAVEGCLFVASTRIGMRSSGKAKAVDGLQMQRRFLPTPAVLAVCPFSSQAQPDWYGP